MTEEKKGVSAQAKTMIVLIVLMCIGIILRWGYVKKEVGTMLDKMFPPKSEQSPG